MRRLTTGVLAGSVAALVTAGFVQPAAAVPHSGDTSPAPADSAAHKPDSRPGPLTKRQQAWRKQAMDKLASGQARPQKHGGSTSVQVAEGKFVELQVDKTDKIFSILSEFGDKADSTLGTMPGPRHNEIPKPDRSVDNTTKWREDFSPSYYEDMFFDANNDGGESMADFFEKQSSGRYSVDGDVSEWVRVPHNASYYGDNSVEYSGGVWSFIADSASAWYESRLAAGKTPEQIRSYLLQFDQWDRYDHDSDGDFAERDGYIDHFQAIHAGMGEEAGGGRLGADAIWSHRWYVNSDDFGQTGPTVGGQEILMGGVQIGDTGLWIGDYTTEPENGGLGVFTHEYAHDLGLPDFYDTNGGSNGVGFWSLMSSGSWLGRGENSIGDTPGYMGPYEKLQLGWLDYKTVTVGQSGNYTLGPAARVTEGTEQAVAVALPDKTTTTEYTTPASGEYAWWTGSADNLNVSLTREIDLTGYKHAKLWAKAWYDIEAGYDYLYAETSTDGGDTWTRLGSGVDGDSKGKWKKLQYKLDGGQKILFRFRYKTDGAVQRPGAFLDDIFVRAQGDILFSDDVESTDHGWTVSGWKRSTGSDTKTTGQFYLVENRQYVDYDAVLRTGPYNFSAPITKPNWVERFPYQNGMLVWYVDLAYENNNTSQHPGHGLALPVDARPKQITYPDGSAPTNRRQPFDGTFGLEATDPVTFHKEVIQGNGSNEHVATLEAKAPSKPGIRTFDGSNVNRYWNPDNPQNSTKVAGHGVTVTVTGKSGNNRTIEVTNPA
ncbi:immune inhibitor A [Halopolyspora algeriensis]|uniref:Immune inhibitor A n=1 Tax=Halopolyspora algeriensis TaxID=1500506 RepID=A0A368VQA1_9ACTN|nr:immune inhibitor A domain-containing protein [Halopolyspora algeriensis]RCW43205.1 immune inhibitor A [Halopolyspora algeriensis]TQM56264.1 immune inhibitor A [Halopolyspora algeriensis]